MFENADDVRRTLTESYLSYELTNEPSAQVAKNIACNVNLSVLLFDAFISSQGHQHTGSYMNGNFISKDKVHEAP